MLAAAGGPNVHPHAASKPRDRERWDRDMADFAKNQKELDGFFLKLLNGKLSGEQVNQQAFSYFGVQGPWYTVGYKMAVTIESIYGRERLIQVMCDPAMLFPVFNAAARELARRGGEQLPLWSADLVRAVDLLNRR